jgi:hypothetical protein
MTQVKFGLLAERINYPLADPRTATGVEGGFRLPA